MPFWRLSDTDWVPNNGGKCSMEPTGGLPEVQHLHGQGSRLQRQPRADQHLREEQEQKQCTRMLFTCRQCCRSGSTGSTCFWASWIRIRMHKSEVWIRIRLWIRILLSPSKIIKNNLDSFCFVTPFWLFIFESDLNVPSKNNKLKYFILKISFLLALWRSMTKIAGSGSISQRSGSGSGSTPKCHGSATLPVGVLRFATGVLVSLFAEGF